MTDERMTVKYSPVLMPFVWFKRISRVVYWMVWLPVKTRALSVMWKMVCGTNVVFLGPTIIRSYTMAAIKIGDNVLFDAVLNHNLVGLTGPTVLCANPGGRIVIGSHSGFSSVVINARERIEIGSYVNVGGNVRIFDHNFHSLDWRERRPPENKSVVRSAPVVIEDDVFIGTNAIILKGTHIGARSIVAAGSVVFGLDVPPDSLVRGNPAVIVPRKQN